MALRKNLMLSLSKHAPRRSQSVGQATNAITCDCPPLPRSGGKQSDVRGLQSLSLIEDRFAVMCESRSFQRA
jgi:hypothetical protein